MTIVCAYQPPGSPKVWMASDSQLIGGDFIYQGTQKKIFRCGDWLVGASGSPRFNERLLEPPRVWDDVRQIRDDLFAYAKEIGAESGEDKGYPTSFAFQFLAGRRSQLFGIASTGAIFRSDWGFLAIGSGQPYAYGAAWALKGGMIGPANIVRDAVLAAIAMSCECGGEIQIETVG